ncbi:LysR family transcriptional regulator substrate-binding protein [Streptomyces sp. NPDC046976]|uniref:LysR family transcriptional regulator substrate-binding protein n=1 Tax=Streptomyces sp. NPDC046976 TaxID=3155258 RepID=UPI00340C7482
MTLEDLKVFAAVCEARDRAAAGRTPAARCGADGGLILHRAVQEGLTALDDAMRLLDELRTGRHGSVAIATGSTTIRHFMGASVKDFRRTFPDVRLEFHTERSSERCLDALRKGLVELARVTVTPNVHGLEQRPVIDLDWVLAVHRDDPLAAEPPAVPGVTSHPDPLRLIPVRGPAPLAVGWAARQRSALPPPRTPSPTR